MCLTRLIPNPSVLPVYGWKFFGKYLGLRLPIRYLDEEETTDIIPKGQWISAARITIRTFSFQEYTSGFHCYLSKEGAIETAKLYFKSGFINRPTVLKVEVRDIRNFGTHNSYKAFTCGQIKVK